MSAGWPISRVFLVVPPAGAGSSRPEPVAEALALSLAAELSHRGVQVHRHVAGASPATVGPLDAALWLADGAGHLPACSEFDVPARLQVAVLPWREGLAERLGARFDGILVADGGPALPTGSKGALPVKRVRLPLAPEFPRETAKLARRLGTGSVALIDLRGSLLDELERVVMQLALCTAPATYLLQCPHDEASRARVRSACARNGVAAWLLSGSDALPSAAPAVDLFVGEPSWQELLWLAAHGVAVCWSGDVADAAATARLDVLRGGPIKLLTGVLHLAARLDGLLEDPVGCRTAGRGLKDTLIGDARDLLSALSELLPRRSSPAGPAATWEAVGPGQENRARGIQPAVDAQPAHARPELDAARVEAQLEALRAQLARGQREGLA